MNFDEKITGWDFSAYFNSGKMKETPLPWDYSEIVKRYFSNTDSLLDMGTGGGEFLKTLSPLPANTYATENYLPNIKIAEDNLNPLGVKVISGYEDSSLPFAGGMFDLVINRHEYYDASEICRILKPGGYFITQQVKWNCDKEIPELLGVKFDPEYKGWSLQKALKDLGEFSFSVILQDECEGYTEFCDPDVLIAYINTVSWLVPDFSREKYHDKLLSASEIIRSEGCFKTTLDRFIIVMKKMEI